MLELICLYLLIGTTLYLYRMIPSFKRRVPPLAARYGWPTACVTYAAVALLFWLLFLLIWPVDMWLSLTGRRNR